MKKLPSLLLLLNFTILFAQKPELVVPIGHADAITSVDFSSDDKFILSSGNDYTARLWNLNGKELKVYADNSGRVEKAMFTLEGNSVLLATESLKRYKLSGEQIKNYPNHVRGATAMDLSPDGQSIVSANGDFDIRIWSISGEERIIFTTFKHTKRIRHLSFSPDGTKILSAGDDGLAILWNQKGEVLQKLDASEGHKGAILSASFSPDGQSILTGGADSNAILWNLNGSIRTKLVGHTGNVEAVLFSKNGDEIFTGAWDKRVLRWNLSGQKTGELTGARSRIYSLALSNQGNKLAAGTGGQRILLWDLQNADSPPRMFEGKPPRYVASQFFPDGKKILSSFRDQPQIWDLEARNVIRFSQKGLMKTMAISPDGEEILLGRHNNSFSLLNLQGEEIQTFPGHESWVSSLAFSSDGTRIISGSLDGSVKIWNRTGGEIKSLVGLSSTIYSCSFSKTDKYIMASSHQGITRLWDANTYEFLKDFKGNRKGERCAEISPDEQFLLTASPGSIGKLWNIASGEYVILKGHTEFISSLCFSPDGKFILSGSGDKSARLWNLQGKPLTVFEGHNYFLTHVDFSPDGKYILTRSSDYTDKIWNTEGKELLSLVSLKEGGWTVTSPSGRFDANSAGINQLYFVQGTEIISLDQLRERYEEPGLLSKVMGFNSEPLKEVKGFGHLKLAPQPQLSLSGSKLLVKLTKREGGIGKVNFFIDGSEKIADINPQRKDQLEIDLSQFERFFLAGEKSKIGIVAYDQSGTLESPMTSIDFVPEINKSTDAGNQASPSASPSNSYARIFALSIGTGDYSGGESLDLSYAEKDAEQMANVLEQASRLLSKKEQPDVRILQTCKSCKDGEKPLPSKANIEKEINRIARESKPQDLFVFYLSGHGKAYQDNWYYLTYEMSNENLTDEELRKNRAISSVEIKEWLAKIPARKKVLIIDACASGQLNQEFTKGKDIPTSDIRAINRLGKHAGLHIISASTGNQASYEASPYGMGILTYGLIKGMLGEALRDGQYIDIIKLFNYAENTIPKLASYVGKQQQPTVYRPLDAQVYDIGKVDEKVKQAVKLPGGPMPMFKSAKLGNTRNRDPLKLEQGCNNLLREYNYKGTSAELIFVGNSEIKQAYEIAGIYTQTEDQIELRAAVYQGNSDTPTGLEIILKRDKTEIDALLEDLVSKAYEIVSAHSNKK